MSWERAELKRRAKIALKRNYWRCVLVAFILMLLSGNTNNSTTSRINRNVESIVGTESTTSMNSVKGEYRDILLDQVPIPFVSFWRIVTPIVIISIVLIGIVLNIFIVEPLMVGEKNFFIKNTAGKAKVGNLLVPFRNGNYGTIVVTCFLRNLFNFLWCLLLIVPGIVKMYEYRMIPYLLADDPKLSRQDAFRISKEMMDGQKLDTFVLDLSFLGWSILGTLTFGLLAIFFVNPYWRATDAELYLKLKQNYMDYHR